MMNEEQNNITENKVTNNVENNTENNEENNKENNKDILKVIFIIISILSIINSYMLINKNMYVKTETNWKWSGECYMQGRNESTEECLDRKANTLKSTENFLNTNEQEMKILLLISLVTIIVLASIIKKIGYTIITIIISLVSALALLL